MAEHSIPPANQNVTADQVADYLSEHPDFLNDYPELLGKLNPPRRDMGETVTDLQQSMISHLRSQVERTEDLAHVMIANSRDNLSSTTQIHECVLRLMAAESFEDLISTIEDDLPAILELDYVAVCIENDDMTLRPAYGIRSIPTTLIDFLIPENKEIILNDNTRPDPNVFGAATDLIKSEALVRLDISPEVPPALLAFGSRDPERFDPHQATELIYFMARAISELMRIWLALPSPEEIFGTSEDT